MTGRSLYVCLNEGGGLFRAKSVDEEGEEEDLFVFRDTLKGVPGRCDLERVLHLRAHSTQSHPIFYKYIL
jgi:hypothetical protein